MRLNSKWTEERLGFKKETVFFLALIAFGSFANAKETTGYLDPVPMAQGLTNQGLLQEAHEKILAEQWAEAAILLRSYLGDDYDVSVPVLLRDIPQRLELVRALTELGRREEALAVLERLRDRLPSANPTRRAIERRIAVLATLFLDQATFSLYQEGLASLRVQNLEVARTRLEKASSREPDHLLILLALAQLSLAEGSPSSAYEKLKYAERLDARNPVVRLWLGRAEMLRGDRRRAIQNFESLLSSTALRENGQREALIVWLSESWIADRKKMKSIDLLRQELDASPPSLPIALAWLRATGIQQIHASKSSEFAKKLVRRALTGKDEPTGREVNAALVANEQADRTLFSLLDLRMEAKEWLDRLEK
jgi:tetratricopeptide (TPR) repeat protein